MRRLRARRLAVRHPSLAATILTAALVVAACNARPGPVAKTTEPSEAPGWPPAAALLERGGTLYQAKCATCHGPQGEGEPNWKTQNADNTYPAPPHDATGHTWHHTDELLIEIIRDGGARFNSPTFRSRMPAWSDTLSEDDIRAILIYIKSLWGPAERVTQSELSRQSSTPPSPAEAPAP